jgi:hypothetical protein
MQNNDIAAARLDAIEDIAQVIEIEVVADGHEDVASSSADGFGRQLGFQFEVELVHLHVSRAAPVGAAFGNSEYDKEKYGERAAGHCCDGLGEKIDDGDKEEHQSNQAQANGDLHAANIKIKRNLELADSRPGVTEHEDGKPVHREAPNDAERVEVCEERNVAAANKNSYDLQGDYDVDDPVARTEAWVRLPKPGAKDAVLRDAV